MNKNKTLKMIILTITFILITCITTTVFADNQLDLETLTGNTAGNTTESTEESDDPIDDLTNEVNGNQTTENATDTNTNINTNINTNTNTNTNTSTYEESNIPYAGPAETILMATAFIVFAIIGGYTFMKLSQYSNI